MSRERSPCEHEAPPSLPTSETECSRSRKREVMNCNKLGGLAKCSEENPVDDLTIEHIANQCCVCFASSRIACETEAELSHETTACLTKLNKLSPHHFAQVFKATGKKNPDITLCEEVQRDHDNLKEWLVTALKEIR